MGACRRKTGLGRAQFNDLFNSLPSIQEIIKNKRTGTSALFMYLMKMRTALPNEDIGNSFHVTRQTVDRLIIKIRNVLKKDFSPQHMNFVRSREELISHNTMMCDGILQLENGKKVVLICDGTYIFVDKSRNYMHQKKTYSGQKKRNFLKLMMVTACDGTIVFCVGPFPAALNDAAILKKMFEETVMFDNLVAGDILLLDRGFRDVVPFIESKGIDIKMPSLVQNAVRRGQLSTGDANRSRTVTALRFMVEIRNGHLKTIWKMFNRNWSSFAQMYIGTDSEICCALINRYFPTLESNRGIAQEIARLMLGRLDKVNEVGNVVSAEAFKDNFKKFKRYENFNELPTLNHEQLFLISLGNYAIKQAESYTKMHIKQNNNQFIVSICPGDISQRELPTFFVEDRDPMLFMIKLKSRFRSNITHKTFVLIDRNETDHKAVLGHYCECYNGWRTMGCCSHIMTLIAFLLFSKGVDLENPAGFLDGLLDDE